VISLPFLVLWLAIHARAIWLPGTEDASVIRFIAFSTHCVVTEHMHSGDHGRVGCSVCSCSAVICAAHLGSDEHACSGGNR
jgi:hypothetical protein